MLAAVVDELVRLHSITTAYYDTAEDCCCESVAAGACVSLAGEDNEFGGTIGGDGTELRKRFGMLLQMSVLHYANVLGVLTLHRFIICKGMVSLVPLRLAFCFCWGVSDLAPWMKSQEDWRELRMRRKSLHFARRWLEQDEEP